MIKRICVITFHNLYDSKRHFSKKLAEALERKGVEVLYINLQKEAMDREVGLAIARFMPQVGLGFNTALPDQNGQFWWDYLRLPHLSILVDPPIYAQNLIKSTYSMIACVDRNDVEAAKTVNTIFPFFLPHAIEREAETDPSTNRDLDVVFIGSAYDYERAESYWRKNLPKDTVKLIEESALLTETTPLTFSQSIMQTLKNHGFDAANFDLKEVAFFVDTYVRGKARVKFLESIDHELHIFGEIGWQKHYDARPWDELMKHRKNIIYHPPMSYPESLEILKRSKISLNSMPFFKDGSHERIFASLICGASLYTDENPYVASQFTHKKDLYLYNSFDGMNEDIEEQLKHEDKRLERVKAGQQKTIAHHTWDSRAETLLSEVSKQPIVKHMLKRSASF